MTQKFTHALWFLKVNSMSYAISFDQQTSFLIENAFNHRNDLDFIPPVLVFEQATEVADFEHLTFLRSILIECEINFEIMKAILTSDESRAFDLIRVDPIVKSNPLLNLIQLIEWPYAGGDVFLRGSFDSWSSSIPMQKRKSDGVWEVALLFDKMEAFSYKFVVDGKWKFRKDLNCCSDSHGNINNVFTPEKGADALENTVHMHV
ncbi:putative Glycogen recognition site of AMP-activated protein kinase [Monocercomonoides exilis]|uniref:putative Glycogen recognition site of AMP-activated protein kinase n=1 Tax=Monocercomonoides exilis TaxID=2049356 RepID=UPI00355A1FA0|nr:putative Glycogen recognition site of AMP-activated protein kinase [Monocercomonoides exilis]|eukprot:MONOS_3362.1-p1 / transcript=MONOS_3362.1 / gene=MONOS_3362 / organism=Monocercomonoides_exilis_PA203 / gene_product=unspecified product / transcript_product=unspecified product / location=Mono_scaffold00078:115967-116789(+) / protein_length=205 / sequence_SO=supercontig / SO=protein_coding / is_pseudo=false